ncbi:MAG: D-aminoacyl-tRNA deacylase [Firmicutes bacterium]|nr:D-aminoacyl-tRNA deacylase [Bacillota bacterium]MDI6706221.1 D-aminoacyl-tRNA deacylase [Bacillota bacterium]
MRAVVQRVTTGRVVVDGKIVGQIGKGFVVLLGVGNNDGKEDVEYMAEKICNLRVFEDGEGKMNLSIKEVGGELLVVSQFTLYGDCRKGRRPGFTDAAPPQKADALYRDFVDYCISKGIKTETGVFQAHMEVELTNDGPVTLLLDSSKNF